MTHRKTSACLLAVILVLAPGLTSGRHAPVLLVQPMGDGVSDKDISLVVSALPVFFQLKVELLDRMELPKQAYYAPRARYRAEKILACLESRKPARAFGVLGLAGADISATKGNVHDWGILGLASYTAPVGVVSMFRCRMGARDAQHARMRFAKVAVHEIGHSLGLHHCRNRGCLMEDARGKVATCDGEYDFCGTCRELLARQGFLNSAGGDIPWPEPLPAQPSANP